MAEWNPQANALFLKAFELPDLAARKAFLARECGDDSALLRAVETLFSAHAQAEGFLAEPLPAGDVTSTFGNGMPTGTPHKKEQLNGTVIGDKYKLLERIGEGGMGDVWLAQQTEPVKRQVAVKVIKAGMDSKQVMARFEAERQALAMMDHPNIAKVLDGGLHENRPFFVMELVKGVPITDFCDHHKLTPKQRLELFVPVCQAIQHAHQKGIIHRDIKPSNVIIAMYDDRPVPKVIDFGVAKATGGTLSEHTLNTGFGGVVGTPQYMSPEQATFNNLDIDTRSDVYSLGVLLYELLTGTPPFAKKELEKKGLLEILRVVREEEPPKPSTKLSTADALVSLSANRGTEPKKLTGILRNELDWIVMKSLEKDRSRRYETANGFAADVNRYLSGEAVQAHPPSTGYRIKKWVRRNKSLVTAATIIWLITLAQVGFSTLQWRKASHSHRMAVASEEKALSTLVSMTAERDAKEQALAAETKERTRAEAGEKLAGERLLQVEAEKKIANEEKQIARAVRDFLQDKLLAQADATAQANALLKDGESSTGAKFNPTIRELLDRAAIELAPDKIEGNFPKHPKVHVEILHTIGRAYDGIGEHQTAIVFLKRSAALRRQLFGPDHPNTLTCMNNLALAYLKAGRLDLALPMFEKTLKIRKVILGADDHDTLNSMNNLAGAYDHAGKLDLALPLLVETLKLRKEKLGPDNPQTLMSMNNLALCYTDIGQPDKAQLLYEEALARQKATLGPDHPSTLYTTCNLARVFLNAGKFDKALPMYEMVLARFQAISGPYHPDTLLSMSNLGMTYGVLGQFDKALPLLEDSVRISKFKLGPDHPSTLASMDKLATGYYHAGQIDKALPLHEETMTRATAILGPDHPFTLLIMTNLGACYDAAGNSEKSIPLHKETLTRCEAKFGLSHPRTLTVMNNLAVAYYATNKIELALPLNEETLKRTTARLGRDHPDTLNSMVNLASSYDRTRQFHKAEVLYRENLPLVKRISGEGSREYATALAFLGLNHMHQKKWSDAEPLLCECLTIREKTQPDAWGTFNIKSMLGGTLLGQKKYAEAEPLLLAGYEGLKQREKTIPTNGNTRIPEALDRLVELYTATNKSDDVLKWKAERAKYPGVPPKPEGKK